MGLLELIQRHETDMIAIMNSAEAASYFRKREAKKTNSHTLSQDFLLPPGDDFGVFFQTLNYPSHEITLHNHAFFELAYVYQGEVTHYFERGNTALGKGDMIFLNPNVHHEVRVEPGGCLINVLIRTDFMRQTAMPALRGGNLIADYSIDYFYHIHRARDFLFFPSESTGEIRTVLEEMAAEIYEKKPGWEPISRAYLTVLSNKLSRVYVRPPHIDNENPEKRRLIAEMIAYLYVHYQDVTLERLSEAFHYSPSHVSHLIKKHTGENFAEILRDIRLNRARESVLETNLSFDEIARIVGFNDRSYLHKTFQKKYGISPSRLRAERDGE